MTPKFATTLTNRRMAVFYEIAKFLSFTKASESLSMTQPAVSFQIARLEEELSTRLFHRSNNSVQLTQSGAKLKSYYECYLSQLADFYSDFSSFMKKPNKTEFSFSELPIETQNFIAKKQIAVMSTADMIEFTERKTPNTKYTWEGDAI